MIHATAQISARGMTRIELAIIVWGMAWVEKGSGFSSTAALKLQNHRKVQSSVRPRRVKKGVLEGLRRRPADHGGR